MSRKVRHRGGFDCVAKQRPVLETNPPVPPMLLDRWRYGPSRLTTAYLPTFALLDHYELANCLKEIRSLVILGRQRLW